MKDLSRGKAKADELTGGVEAMAGLGVFEAALH